MGEPKGDMFGRNEPVTHSFRCSFHLFVHEVLAEHRFVLRRRNRYFVLRPT